MQGADGFYHNNPTLYSAGFAKASDSSAVTLDGLTQCITTPATINPQNGFSIVAVVKAADPTLKQVIVHQQDGSGTGRALLYVENGKYKSFLGGSELVGPDVNDDRMTLSRSSMTHSLESIPFLSTEIRVSLRAGCAGGLRRKTDIWC